MIAVQIVTLDQVPQMNIIREVGLNDRNRTLIRIGENGFYMQSSETPDSLDPYHEYKQEILVNRADVFVDGTGFCHDHGCRFLVPALSRRAKPDK